MSGHPTEIKLHQQSRLLEITFDDGACFQLPYEFLRVYSPSAEVRGHGPGQETLQVGKKDVGVLEVLPVGSYAMKIVYDDGHDSGLYPWEYLYELGQHQADLWQDYLKKLDAAGGSREPGSEPEEAKGGCGSGCGHG
ncbi:MAG: DUF971 domain-containing protein [Gallionella sp.]|nr:DUF971 domain-containing protein [Gallionella sp.]